MTDLKQTDLKNTNLLKVCEKNIWNGPKDWQNNLVDQLEQYSPCHCLLVHGIAETTMKILLLEI